MNLSTAIGGFFIHHTAAGYSPGTLGAYRWALNLLLKYLGDQDLSTITHQQLLDFFAWLHTDYPTQLSGSSIENVWKAIRSFYNWASPELVSQRPDHDLPRPRYASPQIQPFTPEDIQALLKACELTKRADTTTRQSFAMKRPTARRDRALVLFLLDTGLRVSECARLTVGDVDMTTGEVNVKPFGSGRKTKGRMVYIGKSTRGALWRYMASRDSHPSARLFLTEHSAPMDRNSIRLLIDGLSERAGIIHAHPHRFRHTFAIQYLRNGGDVFTLQRLLGHSSLQMVQHYLAIAQTDIGAAHTRASPVDRWRL
jgi:integrase/recombinase XerD